MPHRENVQYKSEKELSARQSCVSASVYSSNTSDNAPFTVAVTATFAYSKSRYTERTSNPDVYSWTNECIAEKQQGRKLILMSQHAWGSREEILISAAAKITLSERSVIQRNQITLTLMVCLRLGAMVKQNWKVFITNVAHGYNW